MCLHNYEDLVKTWTNVQTLQVTTYKDIQQHATDMFGSMLIKH